MFVKIHNSNSGEAFNLDSVLSLKTGGTEPNISIIVKLSDGSLTGIGGYTTEAEAIAAIDSMIQKVGWVASDEGGT